MGKLRYTKDELERIVLTQLDNLNAQQEYIDSLKESIRLLDKANKELKYLTGEEKPVKLYSAKAGRNT